MGYRKSYEGMCPECTELNKKKLVFCTHGKHIYYEK